MRQKKRRNGQFAVAISQFKRNKLAMIGLTILIVIALACSFQGVISPYDYAEQNITERFAPVSLEHLCGTDQYGRDIFTRILKGGQISLIVAISAVCFAGVVGATLGATAAFFGGAYETVVMRIIDILQSIPGLLLAAGISTALGSGLYNSVIAIGLAQVANLTRIMYSSSLSIKGQEYLEAANSYGASKMRMIFKYVIPNCLAPLIVQMTLRLGICISQIASLSFFGLGVQPPTPEWGSLLSAGKQFIRQYWPIVTFPGIAISLTMISVNFIGDGVRDALDPRMKR